MAWTFVRNVDLVEDRPIVGAANRRVWIGRAEFTDGQELRCMSSLFYDTIPNAARRTAARDNILERLNSPPTPREILEEYADDLRTRINRALSNGKTTAQIVTAIQNRLDQLLD